MLYSAIPYYSTHTWELSHIEKRTSTNTYADHHTCACARTHTHAQTQLFPLSAAEVKMTAAAVSFCIFFQGPVISLKDTLVHTSTCPPYVGKQMPQHSIQISRQSEDSQQASMMPQSMSQGQLQSSPKSSVQQQQQQASDVQAPHEACATTMLHSVRNSQNRQAKMQWTQQSGSVSNQPRCQVVKWNKYVNKINQKEQKHKHEANKSPKFMLKCKIIKCEFHQN